MGSLSLESKADQAGLSLSVQNPPLTNRERILYYSTDKQYDSRHAS